MKKIKIWVGVRFRYGFHVGGTTACDCDRCASHPAGSFLGHARDIPSRIAVVPSPGAAFRVIYITHVRGGPVVFRLFCRRKEVARFPAERVPTDARVERGAAQSRVFLRNLSASRRPCERVQSGCRVRSWRIELSLTVRAAEQQ